jgi:phosphomannomutase
MTLSKWHISDTHCLVPIACRAANPSFDLKLTFTPMHGVGQRWVERVFNDFNLKPFVSVPLQQEPDPEFPTVPFPNPEEGKGALKLAIEAAEAAGSPVIIANDPDSDRLAAAEKQPKYAATLMRFTAMSLADCRTLLFGLLS